MKYFLISSVILLTFFNSTAQIPFADLVYFYTTYSRNYCIAEDFNNDSYTDLVLVSSNYNGSPDELTVFMYKQNNHELLFEKKFCYSDDYPTETLAHGDLNNDGLSDLAMGLNNSVVIYYQDHDSGFFSESNYVSLYCGISVYGMAIGDLNNDGLNDLAVSSWTEDSIRIFYQNPDHSFNRVVYHKRRAGRNTLVICDVNHDGLKDLVQSNGLLSSGLSDGNQYSFAVYIQDSITHNLNPPVFFKLTDDIYNYLLGFAVGDLNNDGYPDVIGTQNDSLYIWIHNPPGQNFYNNYPSAISTYNSPWHAVIADLNNDNKNEIIIGNDSQSNISVYESDEYFHFSTYQLIHDGVENYFDESFTCADLNSDGYLDIISTYWGGGIVMYNATGISSTGNISLMNDEVNVFPNPLISDKFTLNYKNYKNASWVLWNSSGERIQSGKLNSAEERIKITNAIHENFLILEVIDSDKVFYKKMVKM